MDWACSKQRAGMNCLHCLNRREDASDPATGEEVLMYQE
jgi:hypothetical protein